MAEELNQVGNGRGRRSSRLLILALAIVILGGAAAGVLWWTNRGGGEGGRTNPLLVDPSGGTGSTVYSSESVYFRGGGSFAGAAGELLIRLSAGQAGPSEIVPVQLAFGEPMSAEEIAAILARLPELVLGAGDQVDFNLPTESPPPPRPGETVEEPFPPPPVPIVPPAVPAGPLEVLRYSPEGEILLAPFVNVTFNQPMVPLTTLEALAAEEVPVIIEPAHAGDLEVAGHQDAAL